MKNIVQLAVFSLLIIVSTNIVAQDIIVKRDESRIEAKIIEVHDEEIHYKKFSNLEGPTYVIETSRLLRIIYQNGDVEEYSQVKEKQKVDNSSSGSQKYSESIYTEEIKIYNGKFYYHNRRVGINRLKNLVFTQGDHEAIKMWNSYKIVQGVGYGAGFAAIPFGVITLAGLGSWDPSWQLILGGGGFAAANLATIANIVMRCMYKNKRIRAVELYNEALKQKSHEDGDYY
ncbi:MAG: hypothetical protein JKY42_09945 [Flavobacteriales bacterium]|nr:hypothetical protein [Flavobacteriales bacterium]